MLINFSRTGFAFIVTALWLLAAKQALALGFTPSAVAEPNIPSFQLLVTKFGAMPNDGKDDTAAIQAGLDALAGAGGGTLIFPQGRYDIFINAKTRRALTLHSKIRLLADPAAPAVLALASNQMVYESIMAPSAYATRLDDAEFKGIIFDANSQNNPVISADETNGELGNPTFRYVIRVFTGARVRVTDCTFINLDNGNTLSFNGNVMSDVIIENSKFLSVGNAQLDHDHSTIYTFAQRVRIANNTFVGLNGAGTLGARTAIETHSDDVTVIGNSITGYLQGANIVGRSTTPSRQLYKNNSFQDVAIGMNIWSLNDNGSENSPTFLALDIVNNTVFINADAWWSSPAMVVEAPAGIRFERSVSRGNLLSLSITNTTISFKNFKGKSAQPDSLSAGIALHGIEGKLAIGKVALANNIITNSIGPCILSTALIGSDETSLVEQNTLHNCGRSQRLEGEGAVLKSAIVLNGRHKNFYVTRNTITMKTDPASTLNGIVVASFCEKNCFVEGNTAVGIIQPTRIVGAGWAEKRF